MIRARDHFTRRELHLQRRLDSISSLLATAAHEPRLQGRFPTEPYLPAIAAAQAILDQLHLLRCVVMRPHFAAVRKDMILPTLRARRDLAGAILLTFGILAGIDRKAPLSPYLPQMSDAHQRLIEAVRALPVHRRRAFRGASSILLHGAQQQSTANLIIALETLSRSYVELFGSLIEPAAFEALFATTVDGARTSLDGSETTAVDGAHADSDSDFDRPM